MFRNYDVPQTIVSLNDAVRELGILSSVRIQQRLSMPDLCEMHYRYPQLSADENLVGARLRLDVESDATGGTMFEGEITAVEYRYLPVGAGTDTAGDLEIVLRAYSLLHRLRKHQRVRSFENITFMQLASELSRQHGMVAPRVWGNPSTAVWPLLIQHQQTDLEFLLEVAAYEGLYLSLAGNELQAFRLTSRSGNRVTLDRQQLMEARLEVNADHACNQVEVVGWSTSKAAIQRGGAKIYSSRVPQLGGSGLRQLVNETTPSEGHASSLAQAELDWTKSSEVTVWAKVAGNSQLHLGTSVELIGVANPVAGRFVLTEVDHIISEEGFFTEINSAPPEPMRRPRGDVVTVGRVIGSDDPELLGRVRVSLLAYNDIRTDWIPQVMPFAGEKKGFVCVPDVGDLVLVLFSRENPAQGLVLGGLYGEKQVGDQRVWGDDAIAAERGKRFAWTTAAGQCILLNETGDLLRLENAAGASIELKGSKVLIKGQRVDFEQI